MPTFFSQERGLGLTPVTTSTIPYRWNIGTTLMLLNGDPLISFVLTTVYTSTCFSASSARWI